MMDNLSVAKTTKPKSFLRFLTGYSSKRAYSIFMIIIFAILVGINIISINLYPEKYSFLRRSVSSLGNKEKNPEGYIIWSIGMCIAGIALIPYVLFLFRVFVPTARKTTYISTGILILSCTGVFGVGIFSEDMGWIHYIFALFAFFGFFVAFSFNMYTLIKNVKDKKKWPRIWQIVLIYLIVDIIMLGFLLAFSLFWLYYFWGIYWFNMYLPLWEWLLLGSYVIYLYGLLFIIKEE